MEHPRGYRQSWTWCVGPEWAWRPMEFGPHLSHDGGDPVRHHRQCSQGGNHRSWWNLVDHWRLAEPGWRPQETGRWPGGTMVSAEPGGDHQRRWVFRQAWNWWCVVRLQRWKPLEVPRKWDKETARGLEREIKESETIASCKSHGDQVEYKSVVSSKGGDIVTQQYQDSSSRLQEYHPRVGTSLPTNSQVSV